ncbi:PIG-L family deacetylase [Armatimonas sp.]|uniref:PIG-L deacetylase family protein n=1 Tax=Armatimonas sp. TaxID=1872638 RepID=UPI00286BC740|nr:PIG-L family deacetylase [Armatimonas sp.]
MHHILCIGAHPDDNELNCGGLATRLRRQGDLVKFVSVTNGDKGHFAEEYKADPESLAARRLIEAESAAAVIGASYETLGTHDGEVYVDKPSTEAMVRCIRSFGEPGKGPDLVLFNRPLDYHRDHRYTAQLILDATYMLTVPLMCPETRHLDRMPVFAYWYDDFKDIQPFVAEVQVPIDNCLDKKTRMVCAHASQFFEWLPYNAGLLAEVPTDEAGRQARVRGIVERRGAYRAEKSAGARINGGPCQHAEAFRICEYGRQPSDDELRQLFGI